MSGEARGWGDADAKLETVSHSQRDKRADCSAAHTSSTPQSARYACAVSRSCATVGQHTPLFGSDIRVPQTVNELESKGRR